MGWFQVILETLPRSDSSLGLSSSMKHSSKTAETLWGSWRDNRLSSGSSKEKEEAESGQWKPLSEETQWAVGVGIQLSTQVLAEGFHDNYKSPRCLQLLFPCLSPGWQWFLVHVWPWLWDSRVALCLVTLRILDGLEAYQKTHCSAVWRTLLWLFGGMPQSQTEIKCKKKELLLCLLQSSLWLR